MEAIDKKTLSNVCDLTIVLNNHQPQIKKKEFDKFTQSLSFETKYRWGIEVKGFLEESRIKHLKESDKNYWNFQELTNLGR